MLDSWSILCNFEVRTVVGLKVYIKWECASSGELHYTEKSSISIFDFRFSNLHYHPNNASTSSDDTAPPRRRILIGPSLFNSRRRALYIRALYSLFSVKFTMALPRKDLKEFGE
jgi:hypothetical protein